MIEQPALTLQEPGYLIGEDAHYALCRQSQGLLLDELLFESSDLEGVSGEAIAAKFFTLRLLLDDVTEKAVFFPAQSTRQS